MIDTAGIFHNRIPNVKHLLDYGFVQSPTGYTGLFALPGGQFQMRVFVSFSGTVDEKVMDINSGEEYVLVHVPQAQGAFVGGVIQACENRLREIAKFCFDVSVFQCSQTKRILSFVKSTYHDNPEFLWEKFSDNAILRRCDTGKWYAALLTVQRAKLGLTGEGKAEVIDLRGLPEEVAALVDGHRYLPGYHMNKKHWYTICLDDSVPTEEICERIQKSYLLAVK